jgi:23S rRNA (pseudouridine1915-N3)-methyltransferase
MKIAFVCVGKPKGPIAAAIDEYEKRIARYFRFEAHEVKETPSRGAPVRQVMQEEGERLLARVPAHHDLVALNRLGRPLTSTDLADEIEAAGVNGVSGITFVVGGAHGLSDEVLRRADRQVSLSALTLPHDLARLVLTEQIYRAGTIIRGEPYHKALDRP